MLPAHGGDTPEWLSLRAALGCELCNAVSGQGTRPLRLERSRAQRCRRSHFGSGDTGNAHARGFKLRAHPRMWARARPIPEIPPTPPCHKRVHPRRGLAWRRSVSGPVDGVGGSGRRAGCDGVVSRKRIESERGSTAANDFACLTPAGNARSASARRTAALFPRRPRGPEGRLIRAD